jgi:hypothetical protein
MCPAFQQEVRSSLSGGFQAISPWSLGTQDFPAPVTPTLHSLPGGLSPCICFCLGFELRAYTLNHSTSPLL